MRKSHSAPISWRPAAMSAGWVLALCLSGPAFGDKPGDVEPREIPVDYAVELAADANAGQVASAAGMTVVGHSTVRPCWCFLRPAEEMDRREAVGRLTSLAGVLQAAGGASVAQQPMSFYPDDPYFVPGGGGSGNAGQWYLVNPYTPGLDLGVRGAWWRGLTGRGETIGMLDDCLQVNHPDLKDNVSMALSWDFGQNDGDPSPAQSEDRHGTSTAGIAAARGGNAVGVCGTAPEAQLAGLRVDFVNQDMAQFFDALLYRNDAIHIKSHSYGITTPYIRDDVTVLVSRMAAAEGVINVRSAGNENSNANAKSALADRTSIAVAAVGGDGQRAWYSNFGACVFVSALSDGGGRGITTTDRTGTAGYNSGTETGFPDPDYTARFGGTSACAPEVAGVVALMRQVNPNLDVRGVKHILARTSQMIDPTHPAWQTNGAGLHFNPGYGFGLVNADQATRLAARLVSISAEGSYSTGLIDLGKIPLPDNDPAGVTLLFDMAGAMPLETVEVGLRFTHTYAGDLAATLVSPTGTISTLAYDHTNSGADNLEWTFSSAAFWGESIAGTWQLHVADAWAQDTGTWDSFSFTAYAGTAEFLPSSLEALSATTLATVFDAAGGAFGKGSLSAGGRADIIAKHKQGQSTFDEGTFWLTASLWSDDSSGGLAAGRFGQGTITLTDSAGSELLTGDLIGLELHEVADGLGVLAGKGEVSITGGRLAGMLLSPGDVFQISFQVDPADLADFASAFRGASNITLTPEPATGLVLACAGAWLLRRTKRQG